MKKLTFLILATLLITLSCVNIKDKNHDLALIDTIENGLLPAIGITGEESGTYNIHERMRLYNVPGISIAYINNGEVVWAKGYGYTTSDSLVAVDENTLFQAASISKPVATLAALSLVEEGKLGLDDNVNDYLKDWQVPENEFTTTEKVTLRRLLSHSAGLTVHGFGGYAAGEDVPTVIQILNGEPPANSDAVVPFIKPGTENIYSGGGFTVMQKLVTDISGEPFPQFMKKRVLSKLGMENSTYEQPLPEKSEGNAAPGHRPGGPMVKGRWHTYPEMAAAGLWTTPTDLMKYSLEVQKSITGNSNRVISREMTGEMLTPQIGSQGLGLALRIMGDTIIFSHGGANEGYRCQLVTFGNEGGQGVAIMTNSDDGGILASEILRSFSDTYDWPIYKQRLKTIIPIDILSLEAFTGNYIYDQADLNLELKIKDNHLEGHQEWDNLFFEMFPEDDLLFFAKKDGATFEFKADESGQITELLIQGEYRFVKSK